VGQPSAQEEAFTIDPAVQNQYPHQQTETLEDALQDSEEEIEAVIEDELVHLHQENEHLLLVQQQMIRWRVVLKRAQIMQQQIVQEKVTQVKLQQAIEDLRQEEHET
jgi:hypothetical protein